MSKIKWIAGFFIVSISMLMAPMVHAFSDVPEQNQFKKEIDHLVELGAIGGYPDGTYRPNNNVTRGQAAKIIAVALRMPLVDPAKPTFKDVPKSDSFYQYIETLAAKGIIGGHADGTFKPGNSLTRAQMSKIIANSFTLQDKSYVQFKDVDRNEWYYLFIDQLATSGITTGYPDNTFKPGGIVTRGQIAAFVSRGIHSYDKSQYSYRNVFLEMSMPQVRVVEGIPSSETEDQLVYNKVEANQFNAKITYKFFYGKLDIILVEFDVDHVPFQETETFFKNSLNQIFKPMFGESKNEKDIWMHSDPSKDLLYASWFSPQSNRIEILLSVNSDLSKTNMKMQIDR